jgi:hypothetical protein
VTVHPRTRTIIKKLRARVSSGPRQGSEYGEAMAAMANRISVTKAYFYAEVKYVVSF